MNWRRIACVSVLAVLSACTVNPKACAFNDIHFSVPAPSDLGGGLVARETFTNWPVVSGRIEVVDCAAREKIDFVLVQYNRELRSSTLNTGNVDGDVSAGEVQANKNTEAFVDFYRSEALVTRKDLTGKAEELGIEVRIRGLDREECGCAAYYPELLGDQKPARERDA